MEKTNCSFCQQIDAPDYNKYYFGVSKPCTCQIIKNDEGFHLWCGGGGDPFQAGVEVEHINYCPICGRKLEE